MRANINQFQRGATPLTQQGRVVTTDKNTITVNVGGRTKRITRQNALAVKPGDRVNLQGESVVGRRKPPPTGATFEV